MSNQTKQQYVFHVFSGLDAFSIKHNDKVFYVPYIAVIASTPEDARQQVADMLDINLEDQDKNGSDNDNFISEFVEEIRKF